MMKKLQRNEPLMKWSWGLCRHYVNYLYSLANKITRIYPSQQVSMHRGNVKWRRRLFKHRNCRGLHRPMWMNNWQQNHISYEYKWFIKSVLQWRFRCMGLKPLLQQTEGNFRCTWIERNKWQPNGQMLIGRGQRAIGVRNPSGDTC